MERLVTIFGDFSLRPGSSDILVALPTHERDEKEFVLRILADAIRAGKRVVVIDVGANIGSYTVAIGNRFKDESPRMFAWEPSECTFQVLRRNIDINGLADCVIPVKQALSSGIRRTGLLVNGGIQAADRAVLALPNAVTGRLDGELLESVSVSSLDAELADGVLSGDVLRDTDFLFVKIDCEGGELSVLEGGGTLWECVPEIVVMVEDLWGSDVDDWLSINGWSRLPKQVRHNSFWRRDSGTLPSLG